MSKGYKRKLKELDGKIDKINKWIYEDGYNMSEFRDIFKQKRIDIVSKIGIIKK